MSLFFTENATKYNEYFKTLPYVLFFDKTIKKTTLEPLTNLELT